MRHSVFSASFRGFLCVPRWIWSSRVFGLLFIHMFSLLVRLLRWCVSRSCCIVYFPLSCAPLMSLSLVDHVAVYGVPLSASLYLLVTMALSMYICSVWLCATLSSLCGSGKLQLCVSSLYDITDPIVTAFCDVMALWCLSLWWVERFCSSENDPKIRSSCSDNDPNQGLAVLIIC